MYRFYVLFYSLAARFPKKDRYTLGQKCEVLILDILTLFFEANAARGEARLAHLAAVDTKLRVLKTLLRLAFDVHAINQHRYLRLQEALQEIGRMLGGWIKSTKQEPPTNP